jgi:cobyrinic acid a,c-diamide synthase
MAAPLGLVNANGLFPSVSQRPRIRLAVARDEAFSFYYQDNLDLLSAWGASIVPVSPLRDAELPPSDGFYIGGGFPEMYAAQLSANRPFRRSIARAAKSGMPVYGECGGLMYLGEGITDFEGGRHEMVGVVPGWSTMKRKRRVMGYVTVKVLADNILASEGDVLRGHEFHWSERDSSVDRPAYHIAEGNRSEGFVAENILASYVHLHFGTSISLARHLIEACSV